MNAFYYESWQTKRVNAFGNVEDELGIIPAEKRVERKKKHDSVKLTLKRMLIMQLVPMKE
jgi:hypothetical protein